MSNRSDRFSYKMQSIEPSGIRKFFDLIIGRDDIISLGVGEPDFATPWSIREEAWYHLEKGHTSYTSNSGLLELREAIAEYLTRYHMQYDPKTEILLTIGVSEALDAVLRAILNPGDEIIVAEPCYVSYQPLAVLCDAKLIRLDTAPDNFIPTAAAIEKLITPKTKALMLCSPNNPTGAMIPKEELEKIAEVVKKHQIWVISDEVYCELNYDKEHVSIGSMPSMKEYSIILNGFSKAFAMTGWRIGYVACPAELMSLVHKLHQYATICAPIMSQYAALEGLRNGFDEVERMRTSYRQRRNLMMHELTKIGLPYIKPEGAFYIFVDIRKTGLSSEEFATKLIYDYQVAVVPGNVFGAGAEGFIRCCYATDIQKIKEALRRIALMVEGKPLASA
ncbi:aminotransferase class I/II-fold pyridoxal phosphate-dependent enzyme [Treponema phagedenis]|uniref:Aminotransferase n=1 Tax=Treponema phagedenis TaxID=162 RepID=A0A0B7GWX7_TREPH|nr:aminotransferase class I/II-fold pyridoxal phosphate-dependent enzyme [Treponema phagedenis]NVP24287.1 aminotransferase class I/II-fold pyridoxal phosphate-dependent enzyme [Treponema phagedenis]QEK00215.1 aminotransferase class I/II-fold pyridoxal phosphate-dependent enzyme [Treponema phagedenis]QEK07709.1 aminotransferase class I/II-fold pyridoxal phosphate-dependent enzyme [Treponema phagedenis]QKS91599.1 aminotransferase class I/II-fold pyridoxal phosphate-dependent enzyme [Treponema pha